jgi:peptidoglycan/xylan/chitin deacetylase (PgdA/CDA1 family)
MKIYIEQNQPFSAPIRWVFDLLATNKQVVFTFVTTAETADFVVSQFDNSDVFLDLDFYKNLEKSNFNAKNAFYTEGSFSELKIKNSKLKIGQNDEKGIYTEGSFSELKIKNSELKTVENAEKGIYTEGSSSELEIKNSELNPSDTNPANLNFEFLIFNSKQDYLASIFYCVNCLQEYGATSLDVHGRYPFSESWQAKTGMITENTVQKLINDFLEKQPKLKHLALKSRKSSIFLTHDIDGLHNAWRTEGLWAAKHLRLDKLLHLLFLELVQRPAWFNIDAILKLHSEYDVRSTFFFLTEKGKNKEGIAHADYDVWSPKIQRVFEAIKAQKSEIGLHKSALHHSDFTSELGKLPANSVKSNRYHFLKFQLPEAWQTMEKAGVELDASLGFAEQYGFRNGYGLPFSPYDFEKKQAMNLTVTPLNIMDGTMEMYMKLPPSEIAKTIINFLENNQKDAVLSILWHNREFAPFRFEAYLGIYKQVLTYLNDTKMPTITASEIVKNFKQAQNV